MAALYARAGTADQKTGLGPPHGPAVAAFLLHDPKVGAVIVERRDLRVWLGLEYHAPGNRAERALSAMEAGP